MHTSLTDLAKFVKRHYATNPPSPFLIGWDDLRAWEWLETAETGMAHGADLLNRSVPVNEYAQYGLRENTTPERV